MLFQPQIFELKVFQELEEVKQDGRSDVSVEAVTAKVNERLVELLNMCQ